MTYKMVLRSLQEVFPQIDIRVLKAIAIEHPKDADAAVEFILSDVLPVIDQPAATSYSPNIFHDTEYSLSDDPAGVGTSRVWEEMSRSSNFVEKDKSKQPLEPKTDFGVDNDMNLVTGHKTKFLAEPHFFDETILGTSASTVFAEDQVSKPVTSLETVQILQRFSDECEAWHAKMQDLCNKKDDSTNETLSTLAPRPLSSFFNTKSLDLSQGGSDILGNTSICLNNQEGQPSSSCKNLQDIASIQDSVECQAGAGIKFNSSQSNKEEQQYRSLVESGDELLVSENDTVSTNDKHQTAIIAAQSVQTASIEFLEGHIFDVETNKETLISALDSAVNRLKEVEHHEELAKQAKEKASLADEAILEKVEDIKQRIKNAIETNDKKAGDISNEKIELATEAWELQLRLINLSDEKDKSFSVIDKIHQILDERLAAARLVQAAAEQEKLEKEKMAHEVLDEQEAILDNLVQEAKQLQQDAEENNQLRELLVKHGHSVHKLQGEIAHACEHVMSLKERVDCHMPLKKSTEPPGVSSMTSSTGSSEKPMFLEFDRQSLSSETPRMIDKEPIVQTNVGKEHAALSDDEWEIFDDKIELYS